MSPGGGTRYPTRYVYRRAKVYPVAVSPPGVQVRIRNPRHTGRNRCWPCTVLNVGVVVLVGAVLSTARSDAVALLAVGAGLSVVWLRGYLVPGTPRIGRQLPEPVRSWFGTHDPAAALPATERLVAAGVLDDDLDIAADADVAIAEQASALAADRAALEAAVSERFDATDVSVNRRLGGGERWFALDDDGQTVSQWEARPLVALDVAGAALLDDRLADWDRGDDRERTTMLALLRYAVSDCPDCGTAFADVNGRRVTCCGGRSLVGARRCAECGYPLIDRNDLPADVLDVSDGGSRERVGAGAGS